MTSNGGHSQRKIKELRWRFLCRHWWILVLFACFVIGVAIALARFENLFNRWIDPGLVTAFILGVGVTAAIGMVITLLGMDGARSYREGLEAEAWTRKALDRLRRDGWSVFHDLEFEGRNIDHVLIGPRGAVTVETKLRNEEWTLTDTTIEDSHRRPVRWVGPMVRQASREARTLRMLLFAGGVRTDVCPVLVLWGGTITGAPTVTIDGVVVGLGGEIADWVSQIRSVPLSTEQIRLAVAVIEGFKAGEGARRPRIIPDRTVGDAAEDRRGQSPILEGQPKRVSTANR